MNLTNGKIIWPGDNKLKETLTSEGGKIKKKKLRVVTALSDPFASINQDEKNQSACGIGLPCKIFTLNGTVLKQYCCDGLAIELMHMLEVDLYLDIDLHISKDGRYGAFDSEDKVWDGMIGELTRDEADLIVADLTITDDRSKVVDFTHPFMEIGVGTLVQVRRENVAKGVWGFLQPVATQLWITAVVAIFTMGGLFWFMEKLVFLVTNRFALPHDFHKVERKRQASVKFSLGASLHYSWSTVVRTRSKVIPPSHTSAKIGTIGLSLCFLVFITAYTAQLAAFLVAEKEVSPFSGGIRDSKLQNPPEGLKLATISGSSIERFFRTSTEQHFINMWRNMKENNVPNTDKAIELLKAGGIDVFFGDYTTLIYEAAKDKNCTLQVIGEPFFKSGFAIALQKNSTLTNIFSQKLLEYEKYDAFVTLSHRWLKRSCKNTKDNSFFMAHNSFRRMSVHDLSGLFLIVVAGIASSSALLAIEYIIYSRRRRQTRIPNKQRQIKTRANKKYPPKILQMKQAKNEV